VVGAVWVEFVVGEGVEERVGEEVDFSEAQGLARWQGIHRE